MPKSNKSKNDESTIETQTDSPTVTESRLDVGSLPISWLKTADALFPRKFIYGEVEHTIGDVPVTALEYLIAYGARQSGGDTSAAMGAFIGQLSDGTIPKNPWTSADRAKVLPDHVAAIVIDGTVVPYDDTNMDHRKMLADAYFAKQTLAKWNRIVSGELTVEGRGPKLSPDEQWLYSAAERAYLARLAGKKESKASAIEKAKKFPINAQAKNDAVWNWIVNQFLSGNRARFDKELTEQKLRDAEIGEVETDPLA